MASNDSGPIASPLLTPRYGPRNKLSARYIAQRAIDSTPPVWIHTTVFAATAGDVTARVVEPDPDNEPEPDDSSGGAGDIARTASQIEQGTDLTGLSEQDQKTVSHYRGSSPTQAQYADQLRAYRAQAQAAPEADPDAYQKKPKRTKTLKDGTFRYLPTKDPTPVERAKGADWLEQQAKDLPS